MSTRRQTAEIKKEKQQHCKGCHDDFYNGEGAKECWSLKSARIVTRFRLGWWTTPDTPGAIHEVRTLNCHKEPGRYAFSERIPACAVDVVRIGASHGD